MSDSDRKEILDKLDIIREDLHSLDKTTAIISDRLSEHVKQDERDLKGINAALDTIGTRLDEYNTQLQIHIQGVEEAHRHNNLLHEEVKLLRASLQNEMENVKSDVTELKKPQIVIRGVMWLIAAVSAILALVATIQSVFY